MTLIVSGIHKHQAFLAIDSRLSDSSGPVEEDAIKCAHIVCSEGKLLLGFTGLAEINDDPTMNWVLKQLSEVELGKMTANQTLEFIAKKLTYYFQQTFYRRPPRLIITASGWLDGKSRHPKLASVANCLDDRGNYRELGEFAFNIIGYAIPSHGASLVILGDLSATHGSEYKKTKKRVMKLLNKNTNTLDEIILDEMIQLITEASYDPASTTINARVKASRMDRKKEGIIYKTIPEESNYSLPGFSTPSMIVSGITVRNDFVENGTTVIGGFHR